MSACGSDVTYKDVRLSIQSVEVKDRDDGLYIVSVELIPESLRYSLQKTYSDFKDLYDAAVLNTNGPLANFDFNSKLIDIDPISRKAPLNEMLAILLQEDSYKDRRLSTELWTFSGLVKNRLEKKEKNSSISSDYEVNSSKAREGCAESADEAQAESADEAQASCKKKRKLQTTIIEGSGSVSSKVSPSSHEGSKPGEKEFDEKRRGTNKYIADANDDANAPAIGIFCQYEYLLGYFLQSKYILRFFALALVAVNQYWSFNDWYYNNRDEEEVYKQYYLTMACFGIIASYILADHIYSCANNAEAASETTKGDLTQEEDRDAICKMGIWNTFFIIYISIFGAAILFLGNLKAYNGSALATSDWAGAISAPIIWTLGWSLVYFYLPAIIKDVAAYRNKQFTDYIMRTAMPMLISVYFRCENSH